MTDADKAVLDNLEREALALLERATFSIRDEDHAHAVHAGVMRRAQGAERRRNVVIDSVIFR